MLMLNIGVRATLHVGLAVPLRACQLQSSAAAQRKSVTKNSSQTVEKLGVPDLGILGKRISLLRAYIWFLPSLCTISP